MPVSNMLYPKAISASKNHHSMVVATLAVSNVTANSVKAVIIITKDCQLLIKAMINYFLTKSDHKPF